MEKAKSGNGDVIERYDTHKGDIRKIRHSGPGWSGVWNLRVVQFPVKHSPPYNKINYWESWNQRKPKPCSKPVSTMSTMESLGVHIDQNQDWEYHIRDFVKDWRWHERQAHISWYKDFFSAWDTLYTLYICNFSIQPHLDYGDLIQSETIRNYSSFTDLPTRIITSA